MKEFKIGSEESNQRLDKYLRRILPGASKSFLYKMLRKKNITLNHHKAEGNEMLQMDDAITIYFSDDTFQKFSVPAYDEHYKTNTDADISLKSYHRAYHELSGISVLYEDKHLLLTVKPKGILSQKANADDLSLNEWLLGYLIENKKMEVSSLNYFKPSVLNRLDRNTSGIVICGKTLLGSREFSRLLKERSLKKFYITYVEGKLKETDTLIAYHKKNKNKNEAEISLRPPANNEDYKKIITKYQLLSYENNISKLEIELITGKSHQIRAHLAAINHPIVGDKKYGSKIETKDGQMLHCYKIVFPKMEGELSSLSQRTFLTEPKNY